MSILISGGLVIDPANSLAEKRDIYIDRGKIAAVPEKLPEGTELIEARGRVVCPGFIDIHMHEDPLNGSGDIDDIEGSSIFACMLRMGVTTAVGGNCGENHAHPLRYLELADRKGLPVNLGMLAGHEYFRNLAGGRDKYGPGTAQQKRSIAEEMENCLAGGCLGISYGIRYVPGMDMDELKETAAPCKGYGRLVAAHIRSDADEVFDAAREFLEAGLELGVPLEISHIGSMAGFGQMEKFLALVDSYRKINKNICCDCYPYDAFSTSIGSTTYDPGWLERYRCGYEVLELSEGKYKGQRCTREIFEEMRRDFPDCTTVCYVMQQSQVDMALAHPGVMLASDGTLSSGQGHPRAAGAFPRLISEYVRRGKISLYRAIDMMTAMPAKQLGLEHKGRLNPGADADVLIFDPERIRDHSSFEEPILAPEGIDRVIVNGTTAAINGKIVSSRSGRAVRL